MSNLNRTKVRRESTSTMPSALPLGEVAFNSETSELFVGTGTGKTKVNNKDFENLSSQLDNIVQQKVSKGEGGIITNVMLSQEVKESMTGGSVAVVGKNAVLNENLTKGCVEYQNSNFIETGDNLYNRETTIPNKYLSGGNPVSNSNGWAVSDFIPVEQGETYIAYRVEYAFYYDENKEVVSSISGNPFTIPDGVHYIRLSIRNNIQTFYLNKGTIAKGYSDYGYKFKKQAPIEVIAKDVIEGDNIKLNTILAENCSFFNTSENLINKNILLSNITLDNNSGGEITNKNYFTTRYISVESNTSYCVLPIDVSFVIIHQFDINKKWLQSSGNSSGLITTLENCSFIRIVVYTEERKNQLCLIKSTEKVPYVDGVPKLNIDNIDIQELKNELGTLDGNSLNLEKTKNLFNENTVIYDKYLSGGNPTDNNYGWKISDFIEVESNMEYILHQQYSKLKIQYSYYYDENKVPISQIGENPFTTPTNCKYVRFSIQNSVQYLQLEKGSEIGYYIPYGNKTDYQSLLNSKWLGKKYCCIGDSITAGSSYPKTIARGLGMVLIEDNGVPGTTVSMAKDNAMSSDDRINKVPLETEVITIMGGSNDWGAYNIKVGNINDCEMGSIEETENTLTFMGAYQLMLNKLYARVPNARIIIMEQPFRANMTPTSEGKVLDDFRKATREIAYKYGYPMIRTYQNSGINQINYTTYLRDLVHPNAVGADRIADVSIAGMKCIEI